MRTRIWCGAREFRGSSRASVRKHFGIATPKREGIGTAGQHSQIRRPERGVLRVRFSFYRIGARCLAGDDPFVGYGFVGVASQRGKDPVLYSDGETSPSVVCLSV